MNQQTTQSLEEIFEKGKTNELQKLNEGLHTRFPDLNREQMIVAKARFIKDNELAFYNEFNQGSRYNDALLEFDNEFLKNQSELKFKTFSNNLEFTKNEILKYRGLGENGLKLFQDFFDAGVEKIFFDLGRKRAWRDFGFGSSNIKNDDFEINSQSFLDNVGFFRWEGGIDKLKKLRIQLIKDEFISEIDEKIFINHFNGLYSTPMINWKTDLYLLIILIDGLKSCFSKELYRYNSAKYEPINCHFTLKDKQLGGKRSWESTRSSNREKVKYKNNYPDLKKIIGYINIFKKDTMD